LFPLALAGVEVDATRRLRQAVMTHTAADARGRTFSLIKLATLESGENPGPEAWATARQAVAAATGLRSGRALDCRGDLAKVLRQSPAALARAADAMANGACAA
jgi:hypothetical protein